MRKEKIDIGFKVYAWNCGNCGIKFAVISLPLWEPWDDESHHQWTHWGNPDKPPHCPHCGKRIEPEKKKKGGKRENEHKNDS